MRTAACEIVRPHTCGAGQSVSSGAWRNERRRARCARTPKRRRMSEKAASGVRRRWRLQPCGQWCWRRMSGPMCGTFAYTCTGPSSNRYTHLVRLSVYLVVNWAQKNAAASRLVPSVGELHLRQRLTLCTLRLRAENARCGSREREVSSGQGLEPVCRFRAVRSGLTGCSLRSRAASRLAPLNFARSPPGASRVGKSGVRNT